MPKDVNDSLNEISLLTAKMHRFCEKKKKNDFPFPPQSLHKKKTLKIN